MCQLTKCCCFSLRQGSQIIGCLCLVASGIAFVTHLFNLVKLCLLLSDVKTPQFNGVSSYIALEAVSIIILGLYFVCALYMMHGIKTENPNYMQPWLVCGIIDFIFRGVLMFISLIDAFKHPENVFPVFLFICFTAASVYLYLCVRSLYKEMKSSPQVLPKLPNV